jgi:hypothetical protein
MCLLFEDFIHMHVQGACGLASCGKEELGLTLKKEEVLGLIPVGGKWLCDGDRWYIMLGVVKVVGWKLLK